MKRHTFLEWLRQYAEAHKELSWIGGKYSAEEYDAIEVQLKALKVSARNALLKAANIEPPAKRVRKPKLDAGQQIGPGFAGEPPIS
jgi:hypothetical protein